jgi:chemotaxis regulatin CheY-phosphate phosphatase CheZ
MGKEDLKKLKDILQEAERDMATLEGGFGPVDEVLGRVRGLLDELCDIAGKLSIKALVRIGKELQKIASQKSLTPEDLTTITYALGSLRAGVQDGSYETLRSAIMETLELLGVEPLEVMSAKRPKEPPKKKDAETPFMVQMIDNKAQEQKPEPPAPKQQPPAPPPPPKPAAPPQPPAKPAPAPRPAPAPPPKPKPPAPKPAPEPEPTGEGAEMARLADQLGGKLVMSSDGGDSFRLELPTGSLAKVMFLLSPADAGDIFTEKIPTEDEHLRNVVNGIKDFMASFADGNLEKAQEVLEDLAGFQGENELFKEIGGLARELHDLLNNMAATITDGLQEILEDQMPDSGNRLEHILELTDEAASTTLDHAEAIQNRMKGDQEKLERLERHLASLKPVGDSAHARMDESARLIRELKSSIADNGDDLSTILTSQGYQDLTGQIVTKIVDFQKGLEAKLIDLVKTFGAKASKKTMKKQEKKPDELYGPASAKVEGAVHSQDDVDALLAQFGF